MPQWVSFSLGALSALGLALALDARRRRRNRFLWRSVHRTAGGSATLRSAVPADMQTLYGQTYALAAHHDDLHELTTSAADIATAFAAGAFHVMLVEVDGAVVGSAVFQDSYRTWSGPSLYVQDIIVDESMRGRGLGTLVFRVLAAVAVARGCDRMFWESHAGNARANAFYSSSIGATHTTGQHQLLTWKLHDDSLRACASAAKA